MTWSGASSGEHFVALNPPTGVIFDVGSTVGLLGGMVYNVRAPVYGAKGDGVTDDTAAIQAAINRANVAGGGIVWFPAGQYLVSTLLYYSGITLQGASGSGILGTGLVSQIFQKSGTADVVVKSSDNTVRMTNVVLRDLFLSANLNSSNTGGVLFERTGGRARCERVVCDSMKNFGFKVLGGTLGGDAAFNVFEGCQVINPVAGSAAFYIQTNSGGQSTGEGTSFIDCYCDGIAASTFLRIDKNGTGLAADSVLLLGCRSEGCGTGINSDGYSCQAIGCRFEVVSGNLAFTFNPVGSTYPAFNFLNTVIAVPGTLTWTDNGAIKSPRILENSTPLAQQSDFKSSPVSGILQDNGGMVFNVKHPAFGAKGDATADDTAAINAAIAAALAVASGDDAFGATVYLPPGTYKVTSLTYNGGRFTLRGAGMRSTCIRQVTAATYCIAPAGSGFPYMDVLFEDFNIELWNDGSSLGGIDMRGSLRSTARRVFIDGAPAGADGIRIAGQGIASTGDAMFCTVEACEFNPQNAASVCIHLVCGASGGSHPDAARIINNFVNGNANTTFVKADVAAVGATGAGNPIIAFNRVEGCGTLFDLNCGDAEIYGGWHEVTSGTMAIILQTGPASYPTRNTKFFGGVYATYGDPTKLLLTDNGVNTQWYANSQRGNVRGVQSGNLAGGTVSLDPGLSDEWLLTITASTTIAFPNAIKGQHQILKIIHDGTATAFTITWPAGTLFAAGAFGTNKAGTNTANSKDLLSLEYNGTNWEERSRAMALA
jgi:hypothetical protein